MKKAYPQEGKEKPKLTLARVAIFLGVVTIGVCFVEVVLLILELNFF